MSTETIQELLTQAFPGATISVDGEGCRLSVTVICPTFSNQNTIKRHRRVYAALGNLMQEAIHALSIQTLTPDEPIGDNS